MGLEEVLGDDKYICGLDESDGFTKVVLSQAQPVVYIKCVQICTCQPCLNNAVEKQFQLEWWLLGSR